MLTISDALARAAGAVGTVGLPQTWTPDNWTVSNPYDNDCALFCSWLTYGDLRNYVVSQFAAQFPHVAAGDVKPGDLACFQWPGSSDDYDHIGQVQSPVIGGTFATIEANTSGPASGHQVARKVRSVDNVVCFVRPPYADPKPADWFDDMATPADLQAAVANGVGAAVQQILTGIRREGRARVYYDAGPNGTEYTYQTSPRVVLAKVTDGFVYPLNPDPTARAGQINSLNNTPYLIVAPGGQELDHPNGLASYQFDNMIEMANGHLRRIAAAVKEFDEASPVIPVTPTAPRDGVIPTRVL